MSPLQPIDLNRHGWEYINDWVDANGGDIGLEPPTDEESASESDDVNRTFQLPGRAVNVLDAFESDESSEGTPLAEIAAALDRDMSGVVCTPGKHASVWSCINTSQQPHEFTGERGIRAESGRGRRSDVCGQLRAIDYWRKFVTDDMLEDIVSATKRRVHALVHGKPSTFYTSRYGAEQWPPRRMKQQEMSPMTREQLEKFIGVCYGLGVTYARGAEHAFSDRPVFGVPWLKRVMTHTEFQRLKSCLSCDIGDPGRERIGKAVSNLHVEKMGKLLEKFRDRCLRVYQPGRELAYDEQVAKTDSRMTRLRQLLQHKKYNGIQLYSICESKTGYLVTFATRDPNGTLGVHGVMNHLLDDVAGRWHCVYADNLFITLGTLRRAKLMRIHLAGTARTSFGFPRVLRDVEGKNLKRGDYVWKMTSDGVLALAWKDTVLAQFMSNWHAPHSTDTVYRRQRGCAQKQAFTAPRVAADYNEFMGAVDQHDALRGSASCSQKSMKWWHTLFWWMLDAAMVNAYCVYTFAEKKAGREPDRRDVFVEKVILELTRLNECATPSAPLATPKRRRRTDSRWGMDCCLSLPELYKKKKRCVLCTELEDKENRIKQRCGGCKTHLCHAHFAKWHSGPLDCS